MRILFVHQNFPGQYAHLLAHYAADPSNEVVFLTRRANAPVAGIRIYRQGGDMWPTPPRYLGCRAASRRLLALCGNVATVAFLLLTSSAALGGHYEILMGKGVEVCEVYTANLNSFKPHYPMLCDRSVNPRFRDLRKPKWERLDFDRYVGLIVTIDKLLRPKYFANPEIRVPSLRGNVEQDNYKYQVMTIDIDNDGKTEPVLRFVESCWPGSPRLGGAALVVLKQDKTDVDVTKSRLIAGDRLDDYSSRVRDVFVHKGKTYFDIWSFRTLDTGQLDVMLNQNGATKGICQINYRPN